MDSYSKKLLDLMLLNSVELFFDKSKDLISKSFTNDKLIKTLLILSVEESLPPQIYIKKHICKEDLYRWQKCISDLCGCKDILAMEIVCIWIESFMYYDIECMIGGKVSKENGVKTFIRIVERMDIVKELRMVKYDISNVCFELNVKEWLYSTCLCSTNFFDVYKHYRKTGNLEERYRYTVIGDNFDITFNLEIINYISYITDVEFDYSFNCRKKLSNLLYVVSEEEKEQMREFGLCPHHNNAFEGLKKYCMDIDETILCFDTYTSDRGIYKYEVLAYGKNVRKFLGAKELRDLMEDKDIEKYVLKRSNWGLSFMILDDEDCVKKKLIITKEIMKQIEIESQEHIGVPEESLIKLYDYLKEHALQIRKNQ